MTPGEKIKNKKNKFYLCIINFKQGNLVTRVRVCFAPLERDESALLVISKKVLHLSMDEASYCGCLRQENSQEPGITAPQRQSFQEFKRFIKSVSACYSYLLRQELNGDLN